MVRALAAVVAVLACCAAAVAAEAGPRQAEIGSRALAAPSSAHDLLRSDGPEWEYRILRGQMRVRGSATSGCGAGVAACPVLEGYVLASERITQTTDAAFAVVPRGGDAVEATDEAVEASAPLQIASWAHEWQTVSTYSDSLCQGGGVQTFTDGGAQVDPVKSVGAFRADVRITPNIAVPRGFDLELTGSGEDVAAAFPPGLRVADQAGAPLVTETGSSTLPGACAGAPSVATYPILHRLPFDPFPGAARTASATPPSYGKRTCRADACTVRVRGATTMTYQNAPDTMPVTGAMTIEWWFDVRVEARTSELEISYKRLGYRCEVMPNGNVRARIRVQMGVRNRGPWQWATDMRFSARPVSGSSLQWQRNWATAEVGSLLLNTRYVRILEVVTEPVTTAPDKPWRFQFKYVWDRQIPQKNVKIELTSRAVACLNRDPTAP